MLIQRSGTTVIGADMLRADLHGALSSAMGKIPYSIQINSLESNGDAISANITTIGSLNRENYNITSGGSSTRYGSMPSYLKSEVIKAVNSLNAQATTVLRAKRGATKRIYQKRLRKNGVFFL